MSQFGTAVILAGGKSSRMGFDKQHLKLDNNYLIDIIIGKLKPIFEQIIVVTNSSTKSRFTGVEFISDYIKGFGPLSGIYSGLRAADSEYVYFIACDMPIISVDYINYMKRIIIQSNVDACVGRVPKGIEPFNAFYSQSLLFILLQQFNSRDLKISNFLDKTNCEYIDINTLKQIDTKGIFLNLNTREDIIKFKPSLENLYE